MDATNNSFQWKGKDEVRQGKTFYTDSMHRAKYSDESIWDYWTSRESHYALRYMELPQYRLSFLITAVKVTPNSYTKLR